jgi:Tfp pilus assembly protein PilF
MESGTWDFASNYLQKAVRLNPKNKDAWFYLSETEGALAQTSPMPGRITRQTEYMGKAYYLDKNDVYVQLYYGILLCRSNDCKKGTKMLEDLLQHPALTNQDREIAQEHYDACLK